MLQGIIISILQMKKLRLRREVMFPRSHNKRQKMTFKTNIYIIPLFSVSLLPHLTSSPQNSKTSPQIYMAIQEMSTAGLNIFTKHHLNAQLYIRHSGAVKNSCFGIFLDLGKICLCVLFPHFPMIYFSSH